MRIAAVALIIAGIAFAVVLGLDRGFDAVSVLILVLVVALGGLGIAIVLRANESSVEIGRCPECGGVISPHAPSCKHCGASIDKAARVT